MYKKIILIALVPLLFVATHAQIVAPTTAQGHFKKVCGYFAMVPLKRPWRLSREVPLLIRNNLLPLPTSVPPR